MDPNPIASARMQTVIQSKGSQYNSSKVFRICPLFSLEYITNASTMSEIPITRDDMLRINLLDVYFTTGTNNIVPNNRITPTMTADINSSILEFDCWLRLVII